MHVYGEIIGKLSAGATLSGGLSGAGAIEGGLTVPIYVYPPEYVGPYQVTPTESERTLATDGLMMGDDITIGAIETEMKSATPTESAQTVTHTAGKYMTEVTVGAIPSNYVGTGITRRDGTDLSASGDTVSVPSGYYAGNASKAVSAGTAGTPTATKGTVSNHSVSVTPSVTNTTGYITGGTKTGTAVTVSASELVSGNKNITESGETDVTNYETVTVPAAQQWIDVSDEGFYTESNARKWKARPYAEINLSEGDAVGWVGEGITYGEYFVRDAVASGITITPTESAQTIGGENYMMEGAVTVNAMPSGTAGTPTATKSAVSNHAVTVTPSVTNTTGYITGGTKTGAAVSVSASELVSGSKSITSNGNNQDVTNYATVNVNVPSSAPSLQSKSKTYTPTESQQTEAVSADNGYDGLDTVNVTVNAISSTYVGSGITQRDSSDLSASGATVTAPSGYYASSATKTISSGSATPASSISATGASVTTGTNTLTLSKSSVANTPQVSAGYISSGTQGNSSVSLSASVTTKGATTYYPGTSDQTISASQYLTGTQTIKAVSQTNLEAGNIKSGTTISISNGQSNIWSVTGTYTGGGASNIVQGTFTTGSSTGTTATVSIPYTGSGYPIACFVYIDGGAYNNTSTGNTTWYNSVQRYAVGVWSMTKSVMTSTPTYGTSGSQNYGVTEWIYKNSTSQATTYSRSSAMTTNVYTSSDATGAGATCVRFKANSGKTLSYYVASTSYGLLASTKYAYIVVYSS